MRVDDPSDGEAADDRVPEHDRVRSAETPAEARDREECYRDLRARDQAPGRPPASGSPDEPRVRRRRRVKWKGLELGPEANRVADEGLAVRRAAEGRDAEGNYGEGGLTPGMRRVEAELEHGTLAPDTEQLALKSPDRFKEKLAKMISLEPDIAPGDHAGKIHDGIRYTFIFEDQFYSAGIRDTEDRLVGNGYNCLAQAELVGEEYKGINSQWRDADSDSALRGSIPYPSELGFQAADARHIRENREPHRHARRACPATGLSTCSCDIHTYTAWRSGIRSL